MRLNVVASFWVAGVVAAAACGRSPADETETRRGPPPEAPEPCRMVDESEPICSFSLGSDASLGGAGGAGGASQGLSDECWVKQQVRVECSTEVGVFDTARGESGSLDVVVGLAGLSGEGENGFEQNNNVYLYGHRYEDGAGQARELAGYVIVRESPYEISVLGATNRADTLLLRQISNEANGTDLIVEGFPAGDEVARVSLPMAPTSHLVSSVDTAVSFVGFVDSPNELTLVEDLVDPSVNALTERDLGQWEGTSTSTPSFLDFRALDGEEGMLGVLLLGGPDPSVFRWDASESKPFARLGRTNFDVRLVDHRHRV